MATVVCLERKLQQSKVKELRRPVIKNNNNNNNNISNVSSRIIDKVLTVEQKQQLQRKAHSQQKTQIVSKQINDLTSTKQRQGPEINSFCRQKCPQQLKGLKRQSSNQSNPGQQQQQKLSGRVSFHSSDRIYLIPRENNGKPISKVVTKRPLNTLVVPPSYVLSGQLSKTEGLLSRTNGNCKLSMKQARRSSTFIVMARMNKDNQHEDKFRSNQQQNTITIQTQPPTQPSTFAKPQQQLQPMLSQRKQQRQQEDLGHKQQNKSATKTQPSNCSKSQQQSSSTQRRQELQRDQHSNTRHQHKQQKRVQELQLHEMKQKFSGMYNQKESKAYLDSLFGQVSASQKQMPSCTRGTALSPNQNQFQQHQIKDTLGQINHCIGRMQSNSMIQEQLLREQQQCRSSPSSIPPKVSILSENKVALRRMARRNSNTAPGA